MRHTFQLITALTLLVGAFSFCSADFEDAWYERPDAPDLKDERLIEHLSDPTALGRAYAGLYLNQRWAGPKYVELLKKDWQAGVVALDYWPKTNPDPLLRYLLTVERPSPPEREDAACLIAEHTDGDQIYTYSGAIRDRALDLWVSEWLQSTPMTVADPSRIWYAGTKSRRWLREYVYKDGPWVEKWGSPAWGTPWRLVEFRQVLALYASDLDKVDAVQVAKTGWLPALRESLATGKCAADVEMDDTKPEKVIDRLTSATNYEDFGQLRYAELLCLVCDRPDWVLVVRKRLQTTKLLITVWKPDAKGLQVPEQHEVTRDLSSSLVYALALASLGKYDAFFEHFDAYLHQKWPEFGSDTVPRVVWLTHPWMQNAIRDKEFQKRWSEMAIPLDWPTK